MWDEKGTEKRGKDKRMLGLKEYLTISEKMLYSRHP